MNPIWTFSAGLLLLIIFGWYLATDISRRKRILGTVLAVLLVAFCLEAVIPPKERINLGIDLRGGTSFLIRIVHDKEDGLAPDTLDQAVEVIRQRVDSMGVAEPVITPQGTDKILVQIPGVDQAKIAAAREQLKQVAKLEFKLVHPQSNDLAPQVLAGTAVRPPGYELKMYSEDATKEDAAEYPILIHREADMDGKRVSSAYATFDQQGWGIGLTFDSQGAKEFGDLSGKHVKERFAIVLDGQVMSAPVIQEAMYQGRCSITGNFTEKEARNLASVLENPLDTPVVIEEQRDASATLGADSIKSGIYAGIAGLLATLVFVVIYYRLSGIFAVIALLANIVILFGIIAMFGFTLTLPGIAGIVLTIGMAVDANVLIYERLREELEAGKSLGAAIDAAYSKAFSAIFDANATTLITAAILFWRASGPVKGFVITLTVGILGSVFCAMIVTRVLFEWSLAGNLLKNLTMLNLIRGRGWDFLSKRGLFVGMSVAACLASILIFTLRGDKNFGIDFTGGDLVMLSSASPVSVAEMRTALEPIGLDPIIQEEADTTTGKEIFTIRAPFETADQIAAQAQTALPDAGIEVLSTDRVGKLVGGELARNSIIALILGVIGIMLFVTLRFEFSFAIGAIVALLHDVIITLGVFAFTGRELSLIMIGAILTIAGYSINDTIVVYDRIREGLRSARKGSIAEIMNSAINDTLSRTLLTSGTTLLTLLTLYIFGGPVLKDFSFSILVGILVGTYSSIFIAAPIVLWWSSRSGRDLSTEVREREEARERLRNVAAGS